MNQKILLIAVVGLLISSLLLADNLEFAYAQFEFTDLSVANSPNFTYVFNSGTIDYLAVGRTATNQERISVFNVDTGALINTISLINAVGNGVFQDMACSSANCFALHGSSAGTDSSDVSGYDITTGSTVGTYNFTAPYTETAGGALIVLDSGTIVVFVTDAVETYYEVINTTVNPFTFINRIDTNTGNNGILDAERATISGVNSLAFSTQAGVNQLQIWNLATSAQICQATVTTTLRDFNFFSTTSRWYISDNEEIEIYSNACADVGTIANTQLCDAGGTEPVRGLSSSTFRNEIYANCDQNVTNPRVVVVNATSSTRITNLFLDGNAGLNHDGITYNRATDTLSVVMTSASEVRIYYFGDAEDTGGGGNQVDGVCGVGTALDCVGEGTSPFAGITGGRNATDIVAVLTNGLGLTNCAEDGSDAETCGSGLFLFVFVLLLTEFLALAGYLGFTGKLNADRQIIDIGLLILMIGFVDLAIAFYLNWIPDLIFYGIVVVIASLLTFGLYNKFRGGD